MFFALAYRLPAYQGAMAAIAARQQQESAPQGRRGGGAASAARYERGSAMENNARTADMAPPATAATLAGLNAQLGGGWFSVKQAKASESPAGVSGHE